MKTWKKKIELKCKIEGWSNPSGALSIYLTQESYIKLRARLDMALQEPGEDSVFSLGEYIGVEPTMTFYTTHYMEQEDGSFRDTVLSSEHPYYRCRIMIHFFGVGEKSIRYEKVAIIVYPTEKMDAFPTMSAMFAFSLSALDEYFGDEALD